MTARGVCRTATRSRLSNAVSAANVTDTRHATAVPRPRRPRPPDDRIRRAPARSWRALRRRRRCVLNSGDRQRERGANPCCALPRSQARSAFAVRRESGPDDAKVRDSDFALRQREGRTARRTAAGRPNHDPRFETTGRYRICAHESLLATHPRDPPLRRRFTNADDVAPDYSDRGEPIAALVGARTAEAIAPPIEPGDRYPRPRPPGNCRRRGIETSPKGSRGRTGPEDECNPGVEFGCPAWVTVRAGSKAEPRSDSECD